MTVKHLAFNSGICNIFHFLQRPHEQHQKVKLQLYRYEVH